MTSLIAALKPSHLLRDVSYVLGASIVLGLLAQFNIHLWFTPVPITLQPLGVMLIASLLGSKRGALAILAYLAEGACGLPVFAGGAFGIVKLVGATGGYLFGFAVSAFVMGYLLERGWNKSYLKTLSAFAIGSAIILGMGGAWVSFFVGVQYAWMMGVAPFIISSVLKVFIAAGAHHSGRKLIHLFR